MAEVKHLRPLHGYQSWGWKTAKKSVLWEKGLKYTSWWILLDFHRKGWVGEICSNSPRSIPLTQLIFDIMCISFVWSFVVCARLRMRQICKKHWMLSPRAAWLNRFFLPSILTLLATDTEVNSSGVPTSISARNVNRRLMQPRRAELERFLTFHVSMSAWRVAEVAFQPLPRFSIHSAPPLLSFQLKRFDFLHGVRGA